MLQNEVAADWWLSHAGSDYCSCPHDPYLPTLQIVQIFRHCFRPRPNGFGVVLLRLVRGAARL